MQYNYSENMNESNLIKKDKLYSILAQSGLRGVTDELQTGLIYYMGSVIKDLRKICEQSQCNEESYKDRFFRMIDKEKLEENKRQANLVIIKDPLGDFKYAEKRELEIEKFYDDKI